MFTRILVALDGSARSLAGLEIARLAIKRSGGSLLLVQAVARTAPVEEFDLARRNVQSLSSALLAEGCDASGWVVVGSPEHGMPWTAIGEGCDLVVTTAQPRHGLDALTHPRLTDRLAANSPVPVLIWPEQAHDDTSLALLDLAGSPVLVPLDGSEAAERAITPARELALAYGRPLWLLRVVPSSAAAPFGPRTGANAEPTREDEETARAYLAAIHVRCDPAGREQVEELVRTGNPAEAILRAASQWPTCVIAMSTRGRGAIVRALLGSVTTTVLRHAHVPVMVIPPATSAAPAPRQPEVRATHTPDARSRD